MAQDDIIMGRRVATGGFGTVFKAQLVDPDTNNVRDVIVKKVCNDVVMSILHCKHMP